MSTGWAKLHNSLWSDRKWMSASLAARGLWASAVSYSNAMRTYGRIDGHLLALFQGTPELAAELVEVGLWDEDGDGWQIHDWEQHQTSRQHAEAVSAKRAEAGRKGGKTRQANHRKVSVTSDDKQIAKQKEANASKVKQEEEGEEELEVLPPYPPQGELLATPPRPAAAVYPDAFETLWAAWPKRRTDSAGKKPGHAAWDRAVNGTTKRKPRATAQQIQAAVEAYAADPNLPPEQYQPNLTTWLNQDRWNSGPQPPRNDGPRRDNRPDAMAQGLDTVARLRAARDARQAQQNHPQLRARTA